MRIGFEYEIISNHFTTVEADEYTEEEWNALSEEEQKEFLEDLYLGIAFRQARSECEYEIITQDYNPPTVEFVED